MGKIQVLCENCGKPVLKWPRDLRRSSHQFCSRPCFYDWKRKQHKKPSNFKANYVKCETCGKIFLRSPSNVKNHVFCSKECYLKSFKVRLVCPECGKNFVRTKSRIRHKLSFCSIECSRKWHTGKNANNYIREIRKCLYCNESFEVRPSDRKKFCSKNCLNNWLSENRLKEKNPFWKPKLIKECEICGKMFEAYPSQTKKRFCGKDCWLKWLREVKVISDEDRAKMLKGLLKRPTKPEKKLIDIIDSQKLPFEYVGDGSVIIKGLNPDFIYEEGKCIIEMFGDYWHRPDVCLNTGREDVRDAIFATAGYRTLIIWEHELKYEDKVINKILSFHDF